MCGHACVCVYVRACVRACVYVRAYVCVCVRLACVYVCMRMRMRVGACARACVPASDRACSTTAYVRVVCARMTTCA